MRRNIWVSFFGLLVAAMFVLVMVYFTVREGQTAVVTTLGKPERALTQPGLYARWPWPVQKVHRYDQRIQCLEGSSEQTLTKDGRSVIVTMYAGWHIQDPILFLERVGSMEEAERNLNGLLSNYKNAVLGQHPFAHLINIDKDVFQFDQIETQILDAARPEAKTRYGIALDFAGIRRIGLPEAITAKVFERMRAEREAIAVRYRSEGKGEAIRIQAEADSQRDQILAEAEAGAKRVRAEGDAQAAEFYKTFEQDPDLAMFLRKLEVLEETLKEKATVILGPETQPFDLLQGSTTLPQRSRK